MDLDLGAAAGAERAVARAPSRRPPGRCTSRRRRSASACARSRSPPAGSCWCAASRCGSPSRGGGAAPGPAGRAAGRRHARRARRRTAAARAQTLPIAVNADSLATWVLPALAPLAGEVRFDLHREDEEHTAALLRAGHGRGRGHRRARPGRRAARPRRWAYALPADGVAGLRPPLVPRRADRRGAGRGPRGGLRPQGRPAAPLPARARCRAGAHRRRTTCRRRRTSSPRSGSASAGGCCPTCRAAPTRRRRAGRRRPAGAIDVALHWQQWRLRSATLDRVRDAVLTAAHRELGRAG